MNEQIELNSMRLNNIVKDLFTHQFKLACISNVGENSIADILVDNIVSI